MYSQGARQIRGDPTFEPQASSAPPVVEQSEFEFHAALSTAVKKNGRPHTTQQLPKGPLSPDLPDRMNRYWMAANVLTVGQIYLSDNPLPRRSLTANDIKPRLLGHSGTSAGMRLLFRQFSTPGGVPSHCGPHVLNSIHEGGELGYSLLHTFGAAFDNPDLFVARIIGDGESETGPLADQS